MKKGAYLIFEPINEDMPNGIEKKIILQFNSFKHEGIDMSFVELRKDVHNTFWNTPERLYQFDFIYFRKETTIDWKFIWFFKKIKKINPNVIIFMDIPTFPYDGEYSNSLHGHLTLIIDHIYRKKIYKIIDRVILTGVKDYSTFYRTIALSVANGIDIMSIPKREHWQTKSIVIGCVGKLSSWHGYERLIEGLYIYKQNGGKRDIHLLIVGDGPEKSIYEDLAFNYKLDKNITFTGFLYGEELEKAYNLMDIGCCSLGRYKSKIDSIGDLKSRDFLARGIPIITGCKIDILEDKSFKYCLQFSNDVKPIDFNMIIDFYDLTLKGNEKYIEEEIKKEISNLIDFKITYSVVLKAAKDLICKQRG